MNRKIPTKDVKMSASDDSFSTHLSKGENKKKIYRILRHKGYRPLTSYRTNKTPIQVECPNHHVWNGLPSKVALPLNNCRQCWDEDKLKPADRVYKVIAARGGTVLIPYDTSRIKMQIRCENHHIFDMTPNSIMEGQWCNVCSHSNVDRAKKRFKAVVDRKGGRILSSYITNQEKVELKCNQDHIFRMRPRAVTQGQWCPKCNRPGPKPK